MADILNIETRESQDGGDGELTGELKNLWQLLKMISRDTHDPTMALTAQFVLVLWESEPDKSVLPSEVRRILMDRVLSINPDTS